MHIAAYPFLYSAYKCVMLLAAPKFPVKDYSASKILLKKGCAPLSVNLLLLLFLIISSKEKTFHLITSKSLTNLPIYLHFFEKS